MEQLKHQARCTKTDFSLKLKKNNNNRRTDWQL